MRNPFHSARSRIAWAHKDIGNFERTARGFFKRTPYARFVEPDVTGLYESHKLKLLKPLPDSLTNRAIGALENLRSALDLMAVAIGSLVNAPDLDRIYFPFCEADTDLKGRVKSACQQLPNDIQALFASFKPYRGGDNLLFAINTSCKASKHNIIVPVISAAGVKFKRIQATSGGGGRRFYWKPVAEATGENEVTFAIAERGLNPNYHVEISMGIQFGNIDVIRGQEVFPILKAMERRVTDVVNRTEAECRLLGLIHL